MNKKGNLFALFPIMAAVSFIAIVTVTFMLMQYGVANDYIFYEMQEISENLTAQGVVTPTTANLTLDIFESYQSVYSSFDNYWLMAYLFYIFITVAYVFGVRETGYFQFFAYLLYGIIFFLYISSLFVQITGWWQENILAIILPSAYTHMPMFTHYMNNIGMYNLIHAIVLIFIGFADFDFSRLFRQKKKEDAVLEGGNTQVQEVL